MKAITVYCEDEDYEVLIQILKTTKSVKEIEDDQEEIDEGDTREEIIANLKQAFRDLQLFKQGKLETRPAREFLKEMKEELKKERNEL